MLSWEKNVENMDFHDANFDELLAEVDTEVITGGSMMNKYQQQQSWCHQQQQLPVIRGSLECPSIIGGSTSGGYLQHQQLHSIGHSTMSPSIIGGNKTGRCH